MSGATGQMIAGLLDEAEQADMCLVCRSDGLHKALRRRVAAGELVMPWPQLFARATTWERFKPDERACRLLISLNELHPDWVFCGPSAAVLQGLSVSWELLDTVHVAVPPGSGGCSPRALRRHVTSDIEPDQARGVPVTPLLRTAFDCARWLSFREGLAVADSALRVGGLPKEELVEYVDEMGGGFHGIAQARMTVTHADGRSENGGESIARAAMWELGFAMPDLQVEVPSPFSGSGLYRVDFRWRLADGAEVYGEHDGNEKYLNPQMNGGSPLAAMKGERRRESGLTVAHASVMRFSPADVADTEYFDWLLRYYGIPREREPLIAVPAPDAILVPELPTIELVPVEAYGLDGPVVRGAPYSGGANRRFSRLRGTKTSICAT